MKRFALAILSVCFLLPVQAHADQKLAEVQRRLNGIQIDAGPVDGAWGAKTEAAIIEFMEFRGLTYDGTFSDNEYTEIVGQKNVSFPKAQGISRWEMVAAGGFPSVDSYELSPDDPTMFTVRLRPNDFDPAKAPKDDKNAIFRHYNLKKQRAEIATHKIIKYGEIYTLDFEVKPTNPSIGSFFQIHAGGSAGAMGLTAFPDSIRLTAGREINNVAVFRGDWMNTWTKLRVVFRADRADRSFYRFYVNGEKTFDSSGMKSDFGFRKRGAHLAFGSYRGKSSLEGQVSYRNIALSRGDLGAPEQP